MAARRKALEVMPFTSTTKYSGVVFEDGKYLLGAPEFVMGNMENATPIPMDAAKTTESTPSITAFVKSMV